MTIFSLLTFTCATVLSLGGDLVSKTCQWDSSGSLYRDESRCADKGKSLVNTKAPNKFMIVLGEDRRIENFKCSPQHVE